MGLFDVFCCCSKKQDPPKMDKIDKSQDNKSFDPVEAPAVKENSESQADDFEEKLAPMKTVGPSSASMCEMGTINIEKEDNIPEKTIQEN